MIRRRVNHTNTKCCECESPKSALKYIDHEGKPVYLWYKKYEEDGSWLNNAYMCNKCWNKISPNSFDNIQKSLRDHRINNLDPESNSSKGDMFEELTCKWRGVKNLNKEFDCYNTAIDHSIDPELGIIQTKGSSPYYNTWKFGKFGSKKFDHLICYCTDKDMNNIVRIYIIPYIELIFRKTIGIYENPNWGGWYKKYRVSKDICESVNIIFRRIK